MHKLADELSIKKTGVDIAGLAKHFKGVEPQGAIAYDIKAVAGEFTEVCEEIAWKLKEAERVLDPQHAPSRVTLNLDALIARRYELYRSLERSFGLLREMRG